MPKHIGIVGISAEGAALCYRTICEEGQDLMGNYAHPEVTLHTFPFNEHLDLSNVDDWEGVGNLMLDSVEKLRAVGADFVICPDNTVHQGLDLVRERSPLPWLHIAEEVAASAEERGLRRLVIFGTRWLMEGPVYPTKLSARGIEHVVPDEPDRERVDRTIWDELVHGRFTDDSLEFFHDAMRRYEERGCDGAILGCTEIPLLVDAERAPIPALDSTRLLARAALREAVGASAPV